MRGTPSRSPAPPPSRAHPATPYDRCIVNLVNSRLSHPATGELEIGPVAPETTYVLRQQVLRPHQQVEEMSLIGSDHPESVVIAAVVCGSGEVVSTAAVSPEEAPAELDAVLPPDRR